MRNIHGKHLDSVSISFPQQTGNLPGIGSSIIYHHEQDSINPEFGIDLTLYLSNGFAVEYAKDIPLESRSIGPTPTKAMCSPWIFYYSASL